MSIQRPLVNVNIHIPAYVALANRALRLRTFFTSHLVINASTKFPVLFNYTLV
nr:MAG TPA: hypothetical protein [Caudoviricetes sp.]